jgi:hypothetical protein
MIQHDMMLFDHGMPRADGTVSKEQRPEADINVEFQVNSKLAASSEALAWIFERANEKYATDYPASVGSHMTNTDSTPFMDSFRRSACARMNGVHRSAMAGTHSGISRPISLPLTRIRIFASA